MSNDWAWVIGLALALYLAFGLGHWIIGLLLVVVGLHLADEER